MNNTETVNLKCQECGFECKTLQSFKVHVMRKHGGVYYFAQYNDPILKDCIRCEECGHECINFGGLARHVTLKHDSEEYYRTYSDMKPGAGICKNPDCNNPTTYRGIAFGGDSKSFGKGYDSYCCNNCAHADPNSKFHRENHGYSKRSSTAEHTAQDILNRENYYERKRIKYLPEQEYKLALKLKRVGVNFRWQKSFDSKNVDFYFFDQNAVVELNEIAHYLDKAKAKRDIIRKDYIMSLPRNENLKWFSIPIDGLDDNQIMEKVFDTLYVD